MAANGGRAAKGKTQAARKAATRLSPAERRALFLQRLRASANVSRSAREAGLLTSTLYRQRGKSASFAAEWDAAVAEALDELEDILTERAKHGVEKPIFYAGESRGTMRIYSDALAMFILKARRPEIYDRVQAAAHGTADEANEIDAMAEIQRRIERLAPGAEGESNAGGDADA
jgi:hypothetical protein